ncbi:hypothetical protein JQ617_06270 [Bradyrhizobium sp. KB893862 SZCCT0404]|uniref:COG3904 family protein n=1 Tax=Bradyrhizobium sp. KB893862 SZCCT0404 TaxID=2807672 RepID=UPI001BA6FBA7|nr:hypothetical protein [Bradyrhizobium sp. KB893862 SZCCT0404]MBR1173555.1 hypothetical protein [Bradyrhizobium sp. KB893862 SZCCT0404]
MLKSLLFLLVVVLVSLPRSELRAADISSGRLYRVGSSAYIVVRGPITAGDADRFKKQALDLIKRGLIPGIVRVYSPGGDVTEALSIGRQLRTLGASTQAPLRLSDYNPTVKPGANACPIGDDLTGKWLYYLPPTGQGDVDCVCASACFLIWAAGTGRHGDVIGVHRPSFVDQAWYGRLPLDAAKKAYDRSVNEAQAYLREMEIPDSIIKTMFAVDSRSMYYLEKRDRLQLYNSSVHLEEVTLARCGKLGAEPSFEQRAKRSDCLGAIYGADKSGAAEYIKRYGGD